EPAEPSRPSTGQLAQECGRSPALVFARNYFCDPLVLIGQKNHDDAGNNRRLPGYAPEEAPLPPQQRQPLISIAGRLRRRVAPFPVRGARRLIHGNWPASFHVSFSNAANMLAE